MSVRPSNSREPSLLSVDSLSRRSSLATNPDVFSDDYALEPIDSRLTLSQEGSFDPDQTLTYQNSNFAQYPVVSNRQPIINGSSSTTKRFGSNEGQQSSHQGITERTLSTSSRYSIPRSQSPYTGPTAPSHPYAMYPQVTRASSIASQSTIRHVERPYLSTRGPEHPYTMYPQNPVDEDEDIGTQSIPLGFPGVGYGSSRGTSSNSEVGDIVGVDGHVEHLPPYTRYADNVVAKGDMGTIHGPQTAEIDTSTSERAQLISTNAGPSGERTDLVEPDETSSEQVRRNAWKEKAHRRVCGGIALWLLLLIIGMVFLAATLGGVIGGVVGRQQGTSEALESRDADPASTDSNTPSCPTGKYTIPINQTQEIGSCVSPASEMLAWGCLDIAYLGMTIGRSSSGQPTVQFDDYSVDPAALLYGPQPPDFNGSIIPLGPYKDKDDQELGIAMFYYQVFNKLVILPSHAFDILSPKRTVKRRDILRRNAPWYNTPLQIGDQPWFCFWNNTINEFWIYLEEPVNASSTLMPSSTVTPAPSSSTSSTDLTSSTKTSYSGSHTNFYPPALSSIMSSAAESYPWPTQAYTKRSYTSYTPYYPTYPKLIKMVEKRQPSNNVQPYCQQMLVNSDWTIVPLPGIGIVFVEELEYSLHPITAGTRKRDTTNQLESNCVCTGYTINKRFCLLVGKFVEAAQI